MALTAHNAPVSRAAHLPEDLSPNPPVPRMPACAKVQPAHLLCDISASAISPDAGRLPQLGCWAPRVHPVSDTEPPTPGWALTWRPRGPVLLKSPHLELWWHLAEQSHTDAREPEQTQLTPGVPLGPRTSEACAQVLRAPTGLSYSAMGGQQAVTCCLLLARQ